MSELRFFATKAEADKHQGSAVVIPCLNATSRVSHIVGELRQFARTAEAISVWRPIHAWTGLRQIRNEIAATQGAHDTVLAEWFARLAAPVEGGTEIQNAWLQGYSTAEGTSAVLQLISSRQAASEAVDRKSAYSMAIFSLYIAVVSMVLSIIFGWLSLG